MCTIQDDDKAMLDKKATVSTGATCMKCRQRSAVVVIRINDPFCGECFLQYCTHKFRSAFGKSRLIRDQEPVLLAFSGGQASVAMIHLVQEGLSKRAQKKLRFRPTLVFIEEGSVVGLTTAERREVTERVLCEMKATGLPFHVYKLHQVFESHRHMEDDSQPQLTDVSTHLANMQVTNAGDSGQQMAPYASCSKPPDSECKLEARLHAVVADVSSHTAKESLLSLLRQRLLVDIARKLGFSKLMVADSATRLAVRMLSNITQGRGAHLAHEMSFADNRRNDLTIVRPMREFSAKEIAVYNRLNNVTAVFVPTLTTKQAGYSLGSLTEWFVMTLQSQSPTTVNTICRTGEKLGLAKSSDTNTQSHCCMCEAPLDTQVGDSSALAATRFSQSMCQAQETHEGTTPGGECLFPDSLVSREDPNMSSPGVTKDVGMSLCYGCQRLTQDMNDISKLPDTMADKMADKMSTKKMERQQMQQNIAEFLVPDSD